MSASASASCLHCGTPVADPARGAFCCAGCEAVHGLLVDQGLTRYYALARGAVLPATSVERVRSHAWLEPLRSAAEGTVSPLCALDLDVQGIHCAACVWLMNELFRRTPGGAGFTVNPALGKARMQWRRGAFDVERFVSEVERFGYAFGPSRKTTPRPSRDLVLRLGICVAATMNVMLFSFSFYFGLSAVDGSTFSLFTWASLVLATGVVLVGGWPFFRAAQRGLSRGLLHLDVPIALGITLVYALSVVQTLQHRGDHAYLDTLCTFITLMVLGRWLQQRVLDRNRRFLLEDDGSDALVIRRREGATVAVVPAPRVGSGDTLLVAPGDLLVVDATLTQPGRFSLDWITGEPEPRTFAAGQTVPAGAFNAGRSAVEARATQSFQQSVLPALLAARPEGGSRTGSARFFDALARYYVVTVLALAGLGTLLWVHAGLHRAVDVAVALLVVTCPCALGIAIPLAQELVHAGLRRRGVLVRAPDLLDRLVRVRTVLFDKTGTLTLGRLDLVEPRHPGQLPPEVRDLAYAMTAGSNHPVSRCLARALAGAGARVAEPLQAEEIPGCGLELVRDGRLHRLGAPAWAVPGAAAEPGVTLLSVDGELLARFVTREAVRPGAQREVARLRAAGLEVWLLSGDARPRVEEFGRTLGLPKNRVLGEMSPAAKAAVVARVDRSDTLFIGDGVNDSLAFAAAFAAGTPAVDRPVMPGKSDVFFLGESLESLGELLTAAQALRSVVRRILALAFTYNLLAVTVAMLGLATPLGAAVAMPASSLAILLATTAWLAGKRRAMDAAPKLHEVPA
ncbi:MAG TPA: heavy metal translocating P-type ATPase metal-binding domain-containing protein [Myxococcaceae bacterium]|nr:heavy metal translocating P-type ATPase metal-binding domain-containing protein [Myxococcaceae bacterium]